MVRRFQIVEQLAVNSEHFVSRFWLDREFSEKFHLYHGDKDIYISDWVRQCEDVSKRVCFFTMKDAENTDNSNVSENLTRCLETQTCTTINDTGETSWQVVCCIVPENNFGSALFKIESSWSIRDAKSQNETCVEVDIAVDCTKKMWGVSDMIESLLATEVSATYKLWFDTAKQLIEEFKSSSHHNDQGCDVINTVLLRSSVHGNYVELKKRRNQRILKGTEKFVELMKSKSEIKNL